MRTIDGIRLFGEQEGKDAVVSFLVGDIHHMDMGTLLDRLGIAVRTPCDVGEVAVGWIASLQIDGLAGHAVEHAYGYLV